MYTQMKEISFYNTTDRDKCYIYTKMNDITLYNMADQEFVLYLMKHWKELSHYIELAWDKQ